jgi:hypothetical protein
MTAGQSFAQMKVDENIIPPPKRADFAIAEVMAVNVLVWAWGHYVLDGYWTQIGTESVELNLRHGFEWDPNQFPNNFFAHPYHGNIYFNAARTNGMNFWESAPFAFGGSLTWEMFMESEFPAYNDLVMTTTGGIALGESLFRFSELVLDDRARGGERVWREIVGTLLNPVGGFNRLIRGDMFQHKAVVNHIRNPLQGYLALGGRARVSGSGTDKDRYSPSFSFTLHYGQPFEDKDSRKPFDYFTFRFWTSRGDTSRNMTILARGVLLGKNFQTGQNLDKRHLYGLFMNYDYIKNDLFNIGGVSLTGGLMSHFPLGSGFELVTAPHLGVIIMGGGNNEYATSSQGRNYNYGWGFKGRADVLVRHQKFGSLYLDYNYFALYSLEGVSGVDRVHLANAVYNLPLWKNFGLGLEFTFYNRNAKYDYFPDVKKDINGARLLISYAFQ